MPRKVYLASNVGMEYFLFLSKLLKNTDFNIETFYYISETKYRLMSRGLLITRLILRLKMYFLYPIYLFFCSLNFKNNSIFIVSSGTFYTPILMQLLLKYKNIKVVQLLYDLYPDILEASKLIKRDSTASKIIGKVSKHNQKTCFGTVYLGYFLRDHTEKRWGKASNSAVIDIATDIDLYDDHFPIKNENEKFVIHYGGQLGQAHDVDSIVSSLKLFYKTNLTQYFEFNFAISGSKSLYFRNQMRDFPLEINNTYNGNHWRSKIKKFHIGLVSLMPAGATICLPSKTYSLMAGGLSIISICPNWSDLAKLVELNNSGWILDNSPSEITTDCINSNTYKEKVSEIKNRNIVAENFISLLEKIKDNPNLIYEKRVNSYNNVRKNYNIKKLSHKWNKFLGKIN